MGFLKFIKSVLLFLANIISVIKDIFVGIFNALKGSILFIKGSIDCIYKILFISFFCLLAYIGYKVFTSASTISKKLDELQKTIVYIQQTSDDLSKATQKIVDTLNSVAKNANIVTEKNGKKLKIAEKLKSLL